MNEGKELWKEYCGFLDKSFSEQIEYNEKKKKDYFEKWKRTKTAKQLCPEGVTRFEDIPLTTSKDYPILDEFGGRMEYLVREVPRRKGESGWEYYDRIGRKAAPILDGWLADKYVFCLKTSGTTGKGKWIPHGKEVSRNFLKYSIALPIMACSNEWGSTKIRKGDKIVHMLAPAPYGSSYTVKAWENVFMCIPPNRIMEDITDMRKKIAMILKTIIEYGEEISYMGALPSTLYMLSQFLTVPAKVFREKYKSMNLGIGKFVLYLKYLQSKMNPPEYKKISEIVALKGIGIGGTGYGLYLDTLKKQYGGDPYNVYANSEGGLPMIGSLKYKHHFIPLLESNYFEFVTKEGKVKRADELEKGEVYTLITTAFGSMLVRCNSEDMFRVVDFEQNGLPILSFESRVASYVNIYGYLNLSEAFVVEILTKAGLKATDAWVIAKLTEPSEHLLLMMEKEWDYSEEEASRAVFNALKDISEDFRNLIRDFEIEQPSQFIEVEYLSKGAFMRYFMQRIKEGVPYGQMKPLKIINPEHSEIINRLRKV